jgi:ABC-type proline/glycine betaine transport system ATPase subunit
VTDAVLLVSTHELAVLIGTDGCGREA